MEDSLNLFKGWQQKYSEGAGKTGQGRWLFERFSPTLYYKK